jgi:hypothetical protein
MSEIPKKKIGRPPKMNADRFDRIINVLSVSSLGLQAICKANGISASNFYAWMLKAPNEFREMYARARENQAQVLADEITEIADNKEFGVIEIVKETKDGTFRETRREDAIRHRELQVDARKWVLSKLLPHKYGDRLEVAADVTFNVPQLARPSSEISVLKPGAPQDVVVSSVIKSLKDVSS